MKKLLIALLVIISSCKKENTVTPIDNTLVNKAALIGEWKLVAKTVFPAMDFDGNGTTETDVYNLPNPCSTNVWYQFNSNGTGEYKSNCGSYKGIDWVLLNYGNTISWKFSGTSGTSTEIIKSVNATTLITSVQLQTGNTITNTYDKQ